MTKSIMQLYRFSPIQDREQLNKAVVYVATKTSELCGRIIGQTLPITSLTIFAHYLEEYEHLIKILNELGTYYNENNGLRIVLNTQIKIGNNTITHLRIRKPDPYRMQVGCNDFYVENYSEFKKQYLTTHPNNLRLINRAEYEMIEFFDPDFDVLAYVLSN